MNKEEKNVFPVPGDAPEPISKGWKKFILEREDLFRVSKLKGFVSFLIFSEGVILSGYLFAVIPEPSGWTGAIFRILAVILPIAAAFGIVRWYRNKQ